MCRNSEGDEPGREGTLQHAGKIKLGTDDCNFTEPRLAFFASIVSGRFERPRGNMIGLYTEGSSGFRHYGRRPKWRPEDHSGALVAAVIFLLILAELIIIYDSAKYF
jgi:hypothetical protein